MKRRLAILSCLIVIIFFVCQTTAMDIPKDGLVAYYSFDDGTATDNSGNGHDGQIHGAVAISGVSGDALFFDGTNDYINVSDSPRFNPPAFTIGAWAKFTGYGNDYQHIISKHVNYLGVREGYCLQYMKISKNLNFFTGTGTSSYNHINSGIIEPGDWHYIVGIFDGTEKRLYIDSRLIGTSSTNVVHSPNDLIIGCGGQFGSQSPQFSDFFLGSIDEVIVYDKALSDVEVSNIYDLYVNPPPNKYIINASSGVGGTISPSGDTTITAGGSQVFNLLADNKYKPASITIDDITIDLKTLMVTFNNVLSDHTICAEFATPGRPPK